MAPSQTTLDLGPGPTARPPSNQKQYERSVIYSVAHSIIHALPCVYTADMTVQGCPRLLQAARAAEYRRCGVVSNTAVARAQSARQRHRNTFTNTRSMCSTLDVYGGITATTKAIAEVHSDHYGVIASLPHRPCVYLPVEAFSSGTASIVGNDTDIDPEGTNNNPASCGQFGTFGSGSYLDASYVCPR